MRRLLVDWYCLIRLRILRFYDAYSSILICRVYIEILRLYLPRLFIVIGFHYAWDFFKMPFSIYLLVRREAALLRHLIFAAWYLRCFFCRHDLMFSSSRRFAYVLLLLFYAADIACAYSLFTRCRDISFYFAIIYHWYFMPLIYFVRFHILLLREDFIFILRRCHILLFDYMSLYAYYRHHAAAMPRFRRHYERYFHCIAHALFIFMLQLILIICRYLFIFSAIIFRYYALLYRRFTIFIFAFSTATFSSSIISYLLIFRAYIASIVTDYYRYLLFHYTMRCRLFSIAISYVTALFLLFSLIYYAAFPYTLSLRCARALLFWLLLRLRFSIV